MLRRLVPKSTVKSVIIAITLLAFGGTATAEKLCRPVHGKVTWAVLSGPECTSPVGLCSTGTFQGGIDGTFSFAASSLIATADTPSTAVILYTGDTTLQTDDGDILLKDAGALENTGDGDLAEVATIVGATGDLIGSTGNLRLQGTFVLDAGGAGEYSGTFCSP